MGESFKKLLWRNKRYSSFIKTMVEALVFFTPLLVPLLIQREWFFQNAGEWADIVAIALSIVFIAVVIIFCLQNFVWENKKYENYMPIVNEQLECICEDKYRALCREMDDGHRYEKGEILLYDAHDSIRTILIYIKQLVSAITGVGLSNLSVTFIYKYMGDGEEWQEIDGSTATTMGKLDDIVNNDTSKTLYHYMVKETLDYYYIRDKAKELDSKYTSSSRDGRDKKKYGSIMCKRYKCMLHGEAAVDAMLSISSYGEKFSGPINHKYIEQLLYQNIARYEWLIRMEMASLFLRHKLRAESNRIKKNYVVELLKSSEWLEDTDQIESEKIDNAIRMFKKHVCHQNKNYLLYGDTIDESVDEVLIANLESGIYKNK